MSKTASGVVAPALWAQSTRTHRILFFSMLFLALVLRLVALAFVDNEETADIYFGDLHILSLSLGKTLFRENVDQLYQSHAYLNLAIILSGCVLLPFARFATLLWAYTCPTSVRSRRNNLLYYMDVIGLVMFAEFFTDLYSTIFFDMDVTLLQGAMRMRTSMTFYLPFHVGLASNVLVTVLTQYLMALDEENCGGTSLIEDSVMTIHERFPPLPAAASAWQAAWCTRFTHFLGSLVFLASWIHLVVLRAPIFGFQMTGLLGLVDESVVKFDYLTMLLDFTKTQGEGARANFTTAFFALMYLVLMLIAPLLVYLGWLALLLIRLPLRLQRAALQTFPLFFSWIGIEVFALVGASNVTEMDMIAGYLFTDKAPELCKRLDSRFGTRCAGVDGTLELGFFSLLTLIGSLSFIRFQLQLLLVRSKAVDMATAEALCESLDATAVYRDLEDS